MSKLLEWLKERKVKYLSIEYAGYGDTGKIEEYFLELIDGSKIDSQTSNIGDVRDLEDFVYEYLEKNIQVGRLAIVRAVNLIYISEKTENTN